MITFSENSAGQAKILVFGVGRTGHSVIEKINEKNPDRIKTFFLDSDTELINSSTASQKICIPNRLIKDTVPETTPLAENQELAGMLKPLIDGLEKNEMVFTICGLGGGMGNAAAPVLMQMLKEKSHWLWSLNTIPFFFEGKAKLLNALMQMKVIQHYSNAVFAIPHDKIFKMVDKGLSMREAFTPAGNLCVDLILDVCGLTSNSGINKRIEIKFLDFKDKLYNKKSTSFGAGEAAGEQRITQAIEKAVNSPLLGKEILLSAERIILNISGNEGLKLDEINEGMNFLYTLIPKEKNIIFGVTIDNKLREAIKVDAIAIGIDTGSRNNWGIGFSGETDTKDITNIQSGEPVPRTSRLGRPLQFSQKPKQTMMDFRKSSKGCFDKSEATIFGGEDLDIPTFMRRKKQ